MDKEVDETYSGVKEYSENYFTDVMQFADFGPRLSLNQTRNVSEDENYFSRFPISNEKMQEDAFMVVTPPMPLAFPPLGVRERNEEENEEGRFSENASSVQQPCFVTGFDQKMVGSEGKNKKRKTRTLKTSEEVESQRMTHIAVERNRRKQMNEHLRVLRSLMPSSYVQRGDQASIIGGAIEFVRELEQLLQCLESQKRRRIFGGGEAQRTIGDVSSIPIQQCQQPPLFSPLAIQDGDQMKVPEFLPNGPREEMAENKSCIADVEVRLLGFDAMIKILSKRRPGQLLKTIAALEEMQLSILHTNITTIEQTVLYSFNVKITIEARSSAEDIANSVQQILSFIDAGTI
ncbi:putative transcription factor bHLH family [Dioscorea sansibarensis]